MTPEEAIEILTDVIESLKRQLNQNIPLDQINLS